MGNGTKYAYSGSVQPLSTLLQGQQWGDRFASDFLHRVGRIDSSLHVTAVGKALDEDTHGPDSFLFLTGDKRNGLVVNYVGSSVNALGESQDAKSTLKGSLNFRTGYRPRIRHKEDLEIGGVKRPDNASTRIPASRLHSGMLNIGNPLHLFVFLTPEKKQLLGRVNLGKPGQSSVYLDVNHLGETSYEILHWLLNNIEEGMIATSTPTEYVYLDGVSRVRDQGLTNIRSLLDVVDGESEPTDCYSDGGTTIHYFHFSPSRFNLENTVEEAELPDSDRITAEQIVGTYIESDNLHEDFGKIFLRMLPEVYLTSKHIYNRGEASLPLAIGVGILRTYEKINAVLYKRSKSGDSETDITANDGGVATQVEGSEDDILWRLSHGQLVDREKEIGLLRPHEIPDAFAWMVSDHLQSKFNDLPDPDRFAIMMQDMYHRRNFAHYN